MKHIFKILALILAAIILFFYIEINRKDVYTLYRHSFIVETLADDRRHIATFDSTSSHNNKYYCDFAVSLFMAQPKRTAKYWCEKGYYKE